MNRAERRRVGKQEEKKLNRKVTIEEANKILDDERSAIFEEAYWEFCLITLDYLSRRRLWKRDGIARYLNFMGKNLEAIGQGYYSFEDLRQALSEELGLDLSAWIPSPEEFKKWKGIEE